MQNQKLSLTVIIFILSILSVYTQSNSINIVKEYYPQIYNSIKTETEKQWSNDKNLLNAVMEGQARAFLEMAESQRQIDPVAMTNALLYGSLPNEEEYNRRIIDDLNITNPYPLLKCNWSIVKTQYEKTKNIISGTHSDKNKSKPMPSENMDKFKDEIYGGESKHSKKKETDKNTFISGKEIKFYTGGASLDFIRSTITGLNNWWRNANPGKGLEFRFWGRQPFGKAFFAMSEMSANFIHHSINDSYNELNGSVNQSYLKTSLFLGIYPHLSPTTTLIIGAGGFVGMNFSTSSQYGRDDSDAYPSSEDLDIFNYGFSGLIGIQYKRYEFAFRGDWGMADMSRDDFNFKSRTIAISVGYLFSLE